MIERGTILHPRVYELLVEAAEAESIPHTFMASAARTGTDADAIHLTRGGIVTGGVGLPLRYIGVGEGVEDLQAFDPGTFVDALLGES